MTREQIEAEFRPASLEDYVGGPLDQAPECNADNLRQIVYLLREIACQLADMNSRQEYPHGL